MNNESTTERNRRRIREAAARLLAGDARVSSGQLTITSLADEAGVPRQYLYRSSYQDLAREFEEEAKALRTRTEEPDERLAMINRLRGLLTLAESRAHKHRSEAARLGADLKIAASQIAYLAAQNEALREQLRVAPSVLSARASARSV